MTDRPTREETDRQTGEDRQIDKEGIRQTDRQTDKRGKRERQADRGSVDYIKSMCSIIAKL